MRSRMICYLIFIVVLSACNAVPHPESGKRVIDKPLSNQAHFDDNDVHNSEYDHEAFLGEEEARKFEQLSPEESKERLGKIVDKIDKDKNNSAESNHGVTIEGEDNKKLNLTFEERKRSLEMIAYKIDKDKDGFVSEEELKDWIKYTQMKYILEDAEKQWEQFSPNKNEPLEWENYKLSTYSFIDEDKDDKDDNDMKMYKEMMLRDKRRWEAADKDQDNQLSKEEFTDFLHPEEASHMHDIVIMETLEDIDKDGDGKISLKEYIGDMYSGNEEDEPDWVKNEREQFETYRDKNKDGVMDKDEVREWILPSDYNDSEAEAKHLIHESDENKDGKLTKEEIVSNYDLFVGSQATDFGTALHRHDEF